MNLGLILECQPGGPDEKVLRILFEKFAPHIAIQFGTAGNKKLLVETCGIIARDLLEDGCDRVAILWDLYPAEWGESFGKHNKIPCRKEDCERITHSMHVAGVDAGRYLLVAVEYMLESWLIADSRALADFLSAFGRHTVSEQQVGKLNPSREKKPKDALSKGFEQRGYSAYRDYVHADKIAQRIQSLDYIQKKCPSFDRFWTRVTAADA